MVWGCACTCQMAHTCPPIGLVQVFCVIEEACLWDTERFELGFQTILAKFTV
jgi:hypothetical protein